MPARKKEPITDMLDERRKVHGLFDETADFAQELKDVFRAKQSWNSLTAPRREFIDMTCTKLARIMCGDRTHIDHYEDIAGYALLAAYGDKLQ